MMWEYTLESLATVTLLALVHLYGSHLSYLGLLWRTRFLSAAGGISISYVFVEILPNLCRGQATIEYTAKSLLPFFEMHIFFVAFLGFLFFYGIERHSQDNDTFARNYPNLKFWIGLYGYAFFNFLVGYAVVDVNDPDIQPLYLFTLTFVLHYLVRDHALVEMHRAEYDQRGRWILAFALYSGWIAGFYTEIPAQAIALFVAFIAGGVIMNVLRYELTAERPRSFLTFSIGGIFYSLILLYHNNH